MRTFDCNRCDEQVVPVDERAEQVLTDWVDNYDGKVVCQTCETKKPSFITRLRMSLRRFILATG